MEDKKRFDQYGKRAERSFVGLYLDAGQAHVCDSALATEAIRILLAG